MNTIYHDSPFSDDQRRAALYNGQLFVYSPTAATRAFIEFAREMIEAAFEGLDPITAQYHLPVHADVPSLEVVFLSEHDGLASPLAGKGIGELALSGVGAAIGNAIHDACGVRMHDYPVTPDKLIASLPSLHEFCAGPT